jgi:hypothetical protein
MTFAHRMICTVVVLAACSSTNHGGGSQSGVPGSGAFANAGSAGTSAGLGGGQAGGSSSGLAANGTGLACGTKGETRGCCGAGTQTCNGQVEFLSWGPCLDTKGSTLTCTSMNPCGVGEFGPNCDAGVDSGSGNKCGAGEFGPGCGMPALCSDEAISNEPEILVGYSPSSGQSVSETGQIKVWVNDERAAIIAPNEQVDATTGAITTPGDRTAKAPDGYLWEPALYIAPQTAESGGTPHFPQVIKGWYNNMPPAGSGRPARGAGVQVPGMDAPPPGAQITLQYSTEYIWNVSDLGLAPGTYIAEFVIHDGDRDRAVGCVTIVVTR